LAALRRLFTTRRAIALAAAIVVIAIGLFLRSTWIEKRLLQANSNLIPGDPVLLAFAIRHGASVFASRCAACHGNDGRGDSQTGTPNLSDLDWLYGEGRPDQIEQIITYGIRAHNSKTWNLAEMPAFGRAVPSKTNPGLHPLSPAEIRDVVELILSVEKRPADWAARQRGEQIFKGRGGCDDCHGFDAKGDTSIGAPNLSDNIWLTGNGSRATIVRTITHGLNGVCPAWFGRIGPTAIREVSLYVYALSHRRTPQKAE
jgi:cytochrome c oxidase cbb3-type subunit 3